MNRHTVLAAFLAAAVFFIIGLWLHDGIFPPQETVINTTDWEVVRYWQQLAENSMVIANGVKNFRPRPVPIGNDTVWIYDTTQVQNIPVQLYSECHNIPILVNSDTNYIPVNLEIEYQLVNKVTLWTNPLPYPITIKQKQKVVRFWGYGAVSFNSQKALLSEIRFGVDIGSHFFVFGGSRLDSKLNAVAEAGVGWRL